MSKTGISGRLSRFSGITWLITAAAIAGFILMPGTAQAKAIETTIHEIILNSPQYSGKTLAVAGIVKDLKTGASQEGKYLVTFDLTEEHSTAAVLVFSHKQLDIKEGDHVRVTGRYTPKADCPAGCWQSAIDASSVTKAVQANCN